jgi:hypothetical protein
MMGRGLGSACAGVAVVALVLLPFGGGARAELDAEGDVIAFFDAAIAPTSLPRTEPAPVAVRVEGHIRTASGDPARLPQLRTISVEINRQGRLFDRGVGVCPARAIASRTTAHARASCPDALVGSGAVTVQAHVAGQPPFPVRAKVLAFNGPRRGGQRLIWAHAHSRRPLGTFLLPFRVSHRAGGVYGTVLSTALPRRAHRWAYLSRFRLALHRTYRWRGARRSYVSAACAAPQGFNSAIFPFARARFGFADGTALTVSTPGRCTVRGES